MTRKEFLQRMKDENLHVPEHYYLSFDSGLQGIRVDKIEDGFLPWALLRLLKMVSGIFFMGQDIWNFLCVNTGVAIVFAAR